MIDREISWPGNSTLVAFLSIVCTTGLGYAQTNEPPTKREAGLLENQGDTPREPASPSGSTDANDSAATAVESTSNDRDESTPQASRAEVSSADGMQEPERTDVTEIAIEDLLNPPVLTASKREERMSESPAVVSVITRSDIAAFRPMKLDERLSYLPGIELIPTYFGFTMVGFRGILGENYNSKSLMLINGHPVFSPTNGNFMLEQMPELGVHQVEVIRGPGSTLYGTNALTGVINIRTELPSEDGTYARALMLTGSMWTRELQLGVTHRSGDFAFALFATHSDSDGYDYLVVDEDQVLARGRDASSTPRPATHPYSTPGYEDDHSSIYGSLAWKDLQVNYGFFTRKMDKFGVIPTVASTGEREVLGWLLDANYVYAISAGHSVTVQLRGDGQQFVHDYIAFPPVDVPPRANYDSPFASYKLGGELTYNGTFLDERIHALAGFAFDQFHTSPWRAFTLPDNPYNDRRGDLDEANSPWLEPYDIMDINGYVKLNLSLVEWLTVDGGIRVNYNQEIGDTATEGSEIISLAPTAGIVTQLYEWLTVKAVYGRSYRAPSFAERFFEASNVIVGGSRAADVLGVDALNEESIDSFDLSIEARRGPHFGRLTGFYLHTNGLIGRLGTVPANSPFGNTDPFPYYKNQADGEGASVYGLEAELETRPVSNLRVSANFSFRQSATHEDDDLWFAPLLANFIGTYTVLDRVDVTLLAQLVGSRSGTLDSGTRLAAVDNRTGLTLEPEEKSYDPYLLLHTQVMLRLTDGIAVGGSIKNITGEQWQYPEYLREIAPYIPGGPGRQFYLMARLDY